MKLSELALKDIIDDENGIKLGKVVDLEIDLINGRILSIKIQRGLKIASIFKNKDNDYIPWNKIVKIGSDVIIVDTNSEKLNKD